ncbi:DNA mismatch repair protein MutL, partial [bacterium]|nr:DNA mismatch repair protein MutL [bacterium]
KIEINGGKIVSVTETGAAEGTTIEVRNLFFNLPARRKFLRTEPTETAHIEHHVTLGALAQPSVAWRLLVDDRPALQLAPTAELSDRLRELYGAELCGQLVPLHLEQGPVTVRGYIGKAGVSRGDRSQQHIFVNRRPVESRGIGFALGEGYHTALMRGRFPISFLFIEIDPALVDVNVHPAKREIRFRDEFAVRQIVIRAVRQALQLRVDTTEPAVAPLPATVAVSTPTMRPALRLRGEPIPAPVPQQTSLPHVTGQPAGRAAGTSPAAARDECPPAPVLPVAPDQVATETDGAWRIVGVLGHLYVLAESPEGLVLIDQHAAHERVLYERMLRELGSGPAPAQKLLLPLTLQLDPRDAEFLRKNLATLQRLGISVSEFGDKTFLVDALPPYLGVVNLGQAFRDIVDELRRTGEQIHARRLSEDRIATTVCRHAVQARDPLGVEELRGLLEQLHQCDLPYTCPHGRPTMIQVSYEELEKKFGRKV